jgi:hypothetical protein
MTKSETLKQLAAASNEARLASLNQQIERLREAKLTSAEELATLIEPLAQAMAALTDETRASLEHVQEYNQEQSNQFFKQLENMTTGAAQRGDGSAAGGPPAGGSRRRLEVSHYLLAAVIKDRHGAARERILALAGASADHRERAGRESGGRAAQSRDRTAEAAQRQMIAMGVDRFVVTLQNGKERKQEERHWHKDKVMRGMAWLKRMNARGYDVLIRPEGAHGLVLLDGLTKAQLYTLRQRGFSQL